MNAAAPGLRLGAIALAIAIAALPGRAGSVEASSAGYRLVGASPASVAAVGESPVYSLYVAGGAGQPVGLSASPNASVVTGNTSTQLPTARIFRHGMEG